MVTLGVHGLSQGQCPALGAARCWVARDTARAEHSSRQLWLTSTLLLQVVARAEQAVPPDHAGGGNRTKNLPLL